MNKAIDWINKQDAGYARTIQERAKHLVAKTLPRDIPHLGVWWDVLKIARGIRV